MISIKSIDKLRHLSSNSKAFDGADVVDIVDILKEYLLVLPEFHE